MRKLIIILSFILCISVAGYRGDHRPEADQLHSAIVYDKKLLPYITLKEGFYIDDYGVSNGDNYSYTVFMMRNETDELYWEIIVQQEDEVVTILNVGEEEHGMAFPSCDMIVIEEDVNFDGTNDILFCLGHFGAQGALSYKCYLTQDNDFLHCPSFAEIPNPSIERSVEAIWGYWRNSAASHSNARYSFIDGEFMMMEYMTLGISDKDNSDLFKEYLLVDGEYKAIKEYSVKDTIKVEERVIGDSSYWKLDDLERWNHDFYNRAYGES